MEDIKGLFQTWPQAFRDRFGRDLGKGELLHLLLELRSVKEQEAIRNQFLDFNVESIDVAIKFLEDNSVDNITTDDLFNYGFDNMTVVKQQDDELIGVIQGEIVKPKRGRPKKEQK
jgi:hypothetical protein